MHSLKYNALVRSLPGSSWVELLTIAVATLQSLPAFDSIKISKFPSNSKANITCITLSYLSGCYIDPPHVPLSHVRFWNQVLSSLGVYSQPREVWL